MWVCASVRRVVSPAHCGARPLTTMCPAESRRATSFFREPAPPGSSRSLTFQPGAAHRAASSASNSTCSRARAIAGWIICRKHSSGLWAPICLRRVGTLSRYFVAKMGREGESDPERSAPSRLRTSLQLDQLRDVEGFGPIDAQVLAGRTDRLMPEQLLAGGDVAGTGIDGGRLGPAG